MKQKKSKILLVEDELIIAEHISSELQNFGYEVLEIIMKGEHVPGYISKNKPDLIIMDINLAGQLDGIETAKIIAETERIPIIFLTGNIDDGTFERSKEAFPYGFVGKPFKTKDLIRAIELVLERVQKAYSMEEKTANNDENSLGNQADYIFVRSNGKMSKVMFDDIRYLKADRSYSEIYTDQKTYLISSPLKKVENNLNSPLFQRTHRSYVVNINAVDEFDDNYVFIKKTAIPVGKSFKKDLFQKFKTV
jgi:DNA-binding LytR/AlgR family response regulator